MAASGGTVSVEERTQLQRVFRLLSLELPLSAITRKLEILDKSFLATDISAPIISSKASEAPTKDKLRHDRYKRICSRYHATLQEEKSTGHDLVISRHHIDAKTLQNMYEHLGAFSTPCEKHAHAQKVVEYIWEIDDDLDGAISYDEFERSYLRARDDRSGLEPSHLFYLTCFLTYDKKCQGRIALDDAMRIFYLKYGDAMEAEMECHFGKLLDEGAHFITFKQFHDAVTKRSCELIDQHPSLAKFIKPQTSRQD